MSSYLYGALEQRRLASPPSTSETATQPGQTPSPGQPGVKSWLDALAALVPAEVLALHAIIIQLASETEEVDGSSQTVLNNEGTVSVFFFVLAILAGVLFVFGRKNGPGAPALTRLDWVRVCVPALAFVGWTMLQPASAFDALGLDLNAVARGGGAVVLAVILGGAAVALGIKADAAAPPAP